MTMWSKHKNIKKEKRKMNINKKKTKRKSMSRMGPSVSSYDFSDVVEFNTGKTGIPPQFKKGIVPSGKELQDKITEQLKASVELADATVQPGSSGALSSHTSVRYDLIPRVFLERTGKRYELGAVKYPPFNFSAGLADKAYIIDRMNHLQEHVQALLWPKSKEEVEDDNEAAIAWATAFLMLCDKKVLEEIRMERMCVQRFTL